MQNCEGRTECLKATCSLRVTTTKLSSASKKKIIGDAPLGRDLVGNIRFPAPNGKVTEPPIKAADDPIVRLVACLTH